MGQHRYINWLLPSKFVGILPLYIGVELVLGLAILNKFSGVYGILSIFTGHPINFWQWLYNFLAILVLPFYISAFKNVYKANSSKFSLVCFIYTADTICGILYTLYFVYYWFSHEDVVPTSSVSAQSISNISNNGKYLETAKLVVREIASSDAAKDAVNAASLNILASQSATPTYELIATILATSVLTVARLYFTLVIISFARSLVKQEVNGASPNFEPPNTIFSRTIRGLEEKAKTYFGALLD